jgi:hypothetical protein
MFRIASGNGKEYYFKRPAERQGRAGDFFAATA